MGNSKRRRSATERNGDHPIKNVTGENDGAVGDNSGNSLLLGAEADL